MGFLCDWIQYVVNERRRNALLQSMAAAHTRQAMKRDTTDLPDAVPFASEKAVASAISVATVTLKALAAAPEKHKRQLIGEQLFPLVQQRESSLAGKITGMLLEMPHQELMYVLESPGALTEKIVDAKAVLQANGEEKEETECQLETE